MAVSRTVVSFRLSLLVAAGGLLAELALFYFTVPHGILFGPNTYTLAVAHFLSWTDAPTTDWHATLLTDAGILAALLFAIFQIEDKTRLTRFFGHIERAYRARSPRLHGQLLALHLVSFGALWVFFLFILDSRYLPLGLPLPDEFVGRMLLATTFVSWILLMGASSHYLRRQLPRFALALYAAFFVTALSSIFGDLASPLFSAFTVKMAAALLAPVSRVHVDLSAVLISSRGFTLRVREACSGIEGIGLYLCLVTAFLALYRERLRFPQALALLPIGAALTLALNGVRIAAFIYLGANYSPDAALHGFHSNAGWILFNLVAVATVYLALTHEFFTKRPLPPLALRSSEVSPFLLPFVAILAAQFFTGAVSANPETLYPLRVFAALSAFAWIRSQYEWPRGEWSWGLPVLAGTLVGVVWVCLTPAHEAALLWRGFPSPLAEFWFALRVFGAVVTVPLAEELAFRGYLLRRLAAADFEKPAALKFHWIAWLGSSLAFGLLHSRPIAGILAGLVFGAIYYRRGRLRDAVVAHAVANAFLIVFAYQTGRWEVWL